MCLIRKMLAGRHCLQEIQIEIILDQLGLGDVYTLTGIDAGSKLIASCLVGKRDACYAIVFMNDLAERLANRAQLIKAATRRFCAPSKMHSVRTWITRFW